MKNKKSLVGKRGSITQNSVNTTHYNSEASQRKRLLRRLKLGAATTLELRHEEDILAPAARVHTLRHKFEYNIHTFWEQAINPGGGKHRVARYVLLAGKWQGGKAHE